MGGGDGRPRGVHSGVHALWQTLVSFLFSLVFNFGWDIWDRVTLGSAVWPGRWVAGATGTRAGRLSVCFCPCRRPTSDHERAPAPPAPGGPAGRAGLHSGDAHPERRGHSGLLRRAVHTGDPREGRAGEALGGAVVTGPVRRGPVQSAPLPGFLLRRWSLGTGTYGDTEADGLGPPGPVRRFRAALTVRLLRR